MTHTKLLPMLALSCLGAVACSGGAAENEGSVDESTAVNAAALGSDSGVAKLPCRMDIAYDAGPAPGEPPAKMTHPANITLKQITNSEAGSMLTYYDVSADLASSNRLIFNAWPPPKTGKLNTVLTSTYEGKDIQPVAQWVDPTTPLSYGFVSTDGKLLVYMKREGDGKRGAFDVWGVRLQSGSTCESFPITTQDYTCSGTNCDEHPLLSPPVYDPDTKQYAIAYTIGHQMYVVYDNGRNSRGEPGPEALKLSDGYEGRNFHRVRLNPKFPNIVMYRRTVDDPLHPFDSEPELFVANWKKPAEAPKVVVKIAGGVHPIWRPDGLALATNRGEKSPLFTEHTVVKVVRTDDDAGVRQRRAEVLAEPIHAGLDILPPTLGVLYATYSPDGQYVALATRLATDRGGSIYIKRLGRLKSDGGRAPVDNPKPAMKVVTTWFNSDTDNEEGQPRLSFFANGAGIVFSTDASFGRNPKKTLPPQVYTVTGYKLADL